MGVDPAIDVTIEQRETILALLKEHLPDTPAWVYGSRVKWMSRPQSDLDLVVFATPGQKSRVGDLREAFEEGNLPFRVDLFVWDAIPETFKEQIGAEHVVLVEAEEQGERDGWTSVQLGDTVDLLTGFPFKSDKYVNDPSAPRLLRGDNIGQGRLRWDGAKRWPQNETQSLNSYWLRGDDVVIAMDRPWIKAGLKFSAVRESDLPALLVQRVSRLRGNSRLNTRFLSYVIGGRDFTNYVLSVQTGTAVPHISARQIKEFEFLLPSLSEQRAIAHILGTLDGKIELNRRMNETLEAMAQTLFKSWFVDFDPVRAKMEGRWRRDQSLPGLPAEHYDLFPDRVVDSELGEIPEGWEVKPLGDVVKVVGGTTPSTKVIEYWEGGIHCWATPKDLSNLSSPVLLDTARKITNAGLNKISSGLLPPGTVLLSSRAPIGYLAISEEPVAINQGFIAMPPVDGISNLFTLYWCNAFREVILNYASGTTFLEISKRNFRRIPMPIADKVVMGAFDKQARPFHRRIAANERESHLLAALRETLLPKLVSGEVEVDGCRQC